MTTPTRIQTIVIAVVVLALGGVVLVVVTFQSTGSGISEMDHGPGDVAISSPAPTSSADADGHGQMPGMDMSGEHGSEVTPSALPTASAEMPGMDMNSGDTHGTTPDHTADDEQAPDRPTGPVLFTFGGGTSAVLLTAGLMRRKDRIRNQSKIAARAARRGSR